ARGAVINNLTIRNKDQVMLRVTVVEVSRNVLKQFGINMTGNWSALNPVGTVGQTIVNSGTAAATQVPAVI
ncbi:hypothetical protein, partial [Serratia bockelmannii]